MHEVNKDEAKSHEDIISIKHKRYEDIVKQVDTLLLNYTSPQNSESQLITSEEYTRLRLTLLKEKNQLEAEFNATGRKIEEWLELFERTFNFVRYASIWFAKGDADQKSHALLSWFEPHCQKTKNYLFSSKIPSTFCLKGFLKLKRN